MTSLSRGERVPVLRETRAGVLLLLVLAVANGAFLYGVPAQAEEHYAWPLAPAASAAFLGAGYLAGVVATAFVLAYARAWREFRMLAPALLVLAVALLAATLVHADRFRWDYPLTWVWTAVYAGVPLGLVWLWRRQESLASPGRSGGLGMRRLRLASALLGCLAGAVAVALYAAPQDTAELWPWQLTPLTARTLGSWYALVAVALVACALSLREPREVVIPYVTLGAWTVLLLALPALHPQDIVRDGLELTVWLVGMAALALLSLAALVGARRSARAAEPLNRPGARLGGRRRAPVP